jgi:hypothetical protein
VPSTRRTTRRLLLAASKWSATLLTILTLSAAAYSYREPLTLVNGNNIYTLERGQFQIIYRPDDPKSLHMTFGRGWFTGMSPRRWPDWGFDNIERVAWVELPPFWLAAFPALPAGLFWWRDRKRNQHGCPRCGYDLSGLRPQSPCPECGTPQ